MEEQISKLYSDYGKYINKFRAFPLVYDGLKIVERRILYSLFLVAKDKFVKSAKVVGHCVGNFHPHGDSSVYGSLVGLVNGSMARGQGNWGIDVGIVSCEPAAMRYTEARSSSFILDMMFEYIKYVQFEELEMDSEPLFLPTKLPGCLVNKNYCQGIGFGSRTVIPSYEVSDLIKRLQWLLGYRKREPVIKPITNCEYISEKEDFQRLLTTGKSKIDYRGTSEVDYGSKSIIVKSIPPNKNFTSLLKKLEKEIQINKTVGFIDESTNKTKVRFTCLKRSMKLNKLKKLVNNNLIGSISFECNMCNSDGKVVLTSIDDMLLNVYKNYKDVNEKVLTTNIKKIQNQINELILISKIKAVLPKWLKEHPDEPEFVIEGVYSDTKIDKELIKKLFDKYTLSKILKIKIDKESLKENKSKLEENLSNLSSYVWTEKYEQYLT